MDRFLGVVWSFIPLQNSYLRFQTQKNLKSAEHVDIHVLQLPIRFQAKILRKKVMAIQSLKTRK